MYKSAQNIDIQTNAFIRILRLFSSIFAFYPLLLVKSEKSLKSVFLAFYNLVSIPSSPNLSKREKKREERCKMWKVWICNCCGAFFFYRGIHSYEMFSNDGRGLQVPLIPSKKMRFGKRLSPCNNNVHGTAGIAYPLSSGTKIMVQTTN